MEELWPWALYALIAALAIAFYLRARASRKGLRCPQCGEYMRIELMEARNQRCNTCGAPLEVTEETHAQP